MSIRDTIFHSWIDMRAIRAYAFRLYPRASPKNDAGSPVSTLDPAFPRGLNIGCSILSWDDVANTLRRKEKEPHRKSWEED